MRLRLALGGTLVLFVGAGRAGATGTVTGVSVSPSPATAGHEVTISVAGSGACQTYVIFGDNQKSLKLMQLPAPSVKHTYAAPGTYVIRVLAYREGNEAPGLSPCSGFVDTSLTVNPGPRAKSMALAPGAKSDPAGNTIYVGGAAGGVSKSSVPPAIKASSVTPVQAKPAGQNNWSVDGKTPTPTRTPTPKGTSQ